MSDKNTKFPSHTGLDAPIEVLHVDDEPDFAEMVANNLASKHDRLSVQSVTDPTAVVETIESTSIDCLLTDYYMPECNGIELLKRVREIDPELPVILFTDTGSEAIASEAISAGVSDYVIKQRVKEQYELLGKKITTTVDARRAAATAEKTRQQLAELAANTPDVLWIFSGDWSELQFINGQYETISGRDIEALEADPSSFVEAVHPEDRETVKQAMEQAAAGQPQDLDYRIDESRRWVASHAEPITNSEGRVVRIVGFTRDITDRKQQELDIRAKNERLERFASMVSHDLRNPLSVVDGYIDLAREEQDSQHLETAANAVDRMERMISDLLMLAREGQEVGDRKPVDLDAIVRSSWASISQKDAELRVDVPVTVHADELRLGQVFENLFRNAIEHGGENITITVGIRDDENGFYVANDGKPIPEQHREQIFETGFTTNRNGTGFGLAIIDRIITAHDWSLELADIDDGVRFDIVDVSFAEEPTPITV